MGDYSSFLEEIGVSQWQMDEAAAAMPFPIRNTDDEHYCVQPSRIDGLGCFASADTCGLIGKMRTGERWHYLGRYANHSGTPNATARMQDGDLYAYGDIVAGDEITLDYRQVRDCILGGA